MCSNSIVLIDRQNTPPTKLVGQVGVATVSGNMTIKLLIFFFLTYSCSSQQMPSTSSKQDTAPVKEFSTGELIIASQLLSKIFDQEMATNHCIPTIDEASLLLRTLRPRMEIIEDDLEALLDNSKAVEDLVLNCDKNCTCEYTDELLREHQVTLSKKYKNILNAKKTEKEINRCLSYAQNTFCQSDLYKTLNDEKKDFSFE